MSHQLELVPRRDVKAEKGTEESGLKQTVVWKYQTMFLLSHLACAALGHGIEVKPSLLGQDMHESISWSKLKQ